MQTIVFSSIFDILTHTEICKCLTLKIQVEKLLRGLEELMKNKVEEETGDLMDQLKTQLKKLDKPSLDKVLDKVVKDEKRDKAK